MKAIYILVLMIFIVSCTSHIDETVYPEKIKIEICNFYGAVGLQLRYVINDNTLKIKENNDFRILPFEKTIYKTQIDDSQYETFYQFINDTNFDTLKSLYEDPAWLDGVNTNISIQIDKKIKNITLSNYDHPVTNSLLLEIDKLIEKEELKMFQN